ncbi:MAG: ABC transporter permease subunit [Streptosporangiales bacterium]|nr:ABC transporter permease subunit [Streptosporangiales bacterium]
MSTSQGVPTHSDVESSAGGLPTAAAGRRGLRRWRAVSGQISKVLYVVATFILVTVVWQAVVTLFHVPSVILPGPIEIAGALSTAKTIIPVQLGWTMYSAIIGFGIAVVSGVVCALLVTEISLLRKTFYPLIISFQSMPHIGIAPLMVVWFGFGTTSHAAMSAVVAFFPIFTNMAHGLDTVRGERLRLFRSYGASSLQTMRKLKLPMSLPFLFAGANVGIILSMLATIVSEFLGSNQGMGFMLVQQSNNLNTPGVFAVLIVLAVVGLLLHAIVTGLRRIALRWSL